MPRRRRPEARAAELARRGLAFLFSNVGVVMLVVAYTIAGAFMFQALEHGSEKESERLINLPVERVSTARRLWENHTLDFSVLSNDTVYKGRLNEELLQYQLKVAAAVRRGWDGAKYARTWSFSSSFLYSLTVITTIGYGHISPRTEWGKIVTIFYSLLGMPIFLLYLANIGSLLARWFKCVYALVCLCRGCPGFSRRRVIRMRQLEISDAESIERPDGWPRRISDSDVTPEYRITPSHHLVDRSPNYRYPVDRYPRDRPSQYYRTLPPVLEYRPERFSHRLPENDRQRFSSQNGIQLQTFSTDNRGRYSSNYRLPAERMIHKKFVSDRPAQDYRRPNNVSERFPPDFRSPADRYPNSRNEFNYKASERDLINYRRSERDVFNYRASERDVFNYRSLPNRYQSESRSRFDHGLAAERYPPDFRLGPRPNRRFQRRPDYFRSASMPAPWERGRSAGSESPTSDFSYVTFDAQSITVPVSVCVAILVGYIMFGSMIFGLWENWDQVDGAYFCFISLSSIGFGDFVPGERVFSARIETSFIVCSFYLMLGMALVAMVFNLMQEQVIHYAAAVKRAVKRICRCKR